MNYKKIFAVFVLALLLVGIGCSKKTGVKGRLILQTGQTGDVRGSKVQLFISSDLTGTAVKEVGSDATGSDQTKSEFEITDVLPNYYYLLAWKDLNNSGNVDNGDIVGVYGGTYRPGYGGSQLQISDGKMTDVGDITMMILKELALTVTAARDANQYITFTYSFNDNCVVDSWGFTGPEGINATDDSQKGSKIANQQYTSEGWRYTNGDPLPVGTYIVTISGTYNSSSFTLADTLSI